MLKNKCRQSYRERQVRLRDGRAIGWWEGDTFVKPVLASKHKVRKPLSWAIDAQTYDEQIAPFAKEIIVWDRESDTKYRASVSHFDRHRGTFDRGYGVQYFLAFSEWEVVGQEKEAGSQQLSLFQEVACG